MLGQRRELILDGYMSEVPDTSVFRREDRISVSHKGGDCVPIIILPETQISSKLVKQYRRRNVHTERRTQWRSSFRCAYKRRTEIIWPQTRSVIYEELWGNNCLVTDFLITVKYFFTAQGICDYEQIQNKFETNLFSNRRKLQGGARNVIPLIVHVTYFYYYKNI